MNWEAQFSEIVSFSPPKMNQGLLSLGKNILLKKKKKLTVNFFPLC